MKKTLWSILLLAFTTLAAAQTPKIADLQYNGQGRLHYAKLEPGASVGESSAQEFIAGLLGSPFYVSVSRTERDLLGYTHITYNVMLDGKPVSGRRVVAHFKDGRLGWLNGDLRMDGAPENASFSLTEEQALGYALAKVNAVRYKWANRAEENHMREVLGDPDFTYYPHGEKVWLEKDGAIQPAWKFNIYAEEPLYRADVFVQASNGMVLDEHSKICTANTPGTVTTKYSGTQTITCDQFSGGFRLRQTVSGNGVETYDMNNGTSYTAATDFTNASAAWTFTNIDQGALDAHWGAEKTHEYYMSIHSRNSINNFGLKLLSYVHYGNSYTNAFWDGQRMTYGDGNGSSMRIFSALDVCGHEITHGVNDYAGNLLYSYESGALSESFSDIFGTAIENFARPGNWNWKIGEDITSNGFGLRTMQNPNSYGDPDTYKGTFWHSSSSDNGGVHTNSGVPNYWFYLLTVGGASTNDAGSAYNVQGVGINNAAAIAYRAFAYYFTPNTDFAAARIACIQAAKDLFGDCSNEMIQTANAWYAVGVGKQISATAVLPDFTTKVASFCSVPAAVSFSNTTPYGTAYQWSFGDGTSSLAQNPVHTYTAPGNYNVKLAATGCSGTDSIIKNAYISINFPAAPAVAGSTVCYGSPASMVATASGDIQWYDTPTTMFAFQTGTLLNIPSLTATTTYYVDNTDVATPVTGGKTVISGGGYLGNNSLYLEFDVHQNCTINTLQMNASGSGMRTIELRNSSNFVIDSRTVSLVQGVNTVTVDFVVTPGVDYRLGLSGPTSPNIYRSNSGVAYPYAIGDLVTITGSSAGTGNYYWFYKWTVTRASCVSPKSSVTASVMPLPQISLAALADHACVDDAPIALFAFPSGGFLTGNGAQGSNFNPAIAGPGSHTLTYLYTDENGCTDSQQIVLTAEECTGVSGGGTRNALVVYPNPARNIVTVSGLTIGSMINIHDNTGRVIRELRTNGREMSINLEGVAKGMYMLTVTGADGKTSPVKLMVE